MDNCAPRSVPMDLAVLVVVDDALALFGHLHGRLRLRLVLRFDRLQRPDAAINTNVSFQLLYLAPTECLLVPMDRLICRKASNCFFFRHHRPFFIVNKHFVLHKPPYLSNALLYANVLSRVNRDDVRQSNSHEQGLKNSSSGVSRTRAPSNDTRDCLLR